MLTYIPCTYFVVLNIVKLCEYIFFPNDLVVNLSAYIFNYMPGFPVQISFSVFQWISSFIAVFIVVLMALLILYSNKSKENIINFLIYSASFAVIVVIGVSVVGRMIGLRTLFVSGVLLIVLFMRMLLTELNKIIK